MEKKFCLRKKTKKKIRILIPLLIIVGILISIWLYHPAFLISIDYRMRGFNNTSPLSSAKRIFAEDNISNDKQYFKPLEECTSTNEEDYCWVSIDLTMLNISPLKISNIQTYIQGENNDSIIIGKLGSEIIQYVDIFSQNNLDGMSLFIYRDGKTDEEILEYLKGVTIKIYYETLLNSECQMTISLKNYIVE